jgi:hypothetical protein
MVTGNGSTSSGTGGPAATDHTEIEWQFDADELELVEGWLDRHASGPTGFVVAPAVPDSKPLRALTRGKRWKKFEKVLEDLNGAGLPNKSVR